MNLQQFLRILRAHGRLMGVTLLVAVGTTLVVSLLLPKRYTATATVVVEARGVDPISGAVLPMLPMTGYLATQVDIIQSHSVARGAVDLLKLADSPAEKELYQEDTDGRGSIRDWLADRLIKYLKVEPSRESSVIDISYSSKDPRFSAAMANAIVQSYIKTIL